MLGSGHLALVDKILLRLSDICDGKAAPRILILSGESGVGKSRIIREVYERLQAGQPAQRAYWPPISADDTPTASGDYHPLRKVIGPNINSFVRDPEALPEWTWWTINCGLTDSGRTLSLESALNAQIRAHIPYIRFAWSKVASIGQRLQSFQEDESFRKELNSFLRDASADVTTELSILGLETFLNLKGVPVPGASLALSSGLRAIDKLRERHNILEEVRRGGGLSMGSIDVARTAYRQLYRVMHQHMPMIVCVEDCHHIDQPISDFLEYMALPILDRPTLVLASGWPSQNGENPVYEKWLRRVLDDRTVDNRVRIPLAESWEIPVLPLEDRVELVRRYAPHSQDAVVKRVAEAFPNPYALELFITDPQTQRFNFADGSLKVETADIAATPPGVVDLVERRWRSLPPDVKSLLSIASVLSSQRNERLPQAYFGDFSAQIVEAVHRHIEETDVDTFQPVLDNCPSWVMPSPIEGSFIFRDSAEEQVVRARTSPNRWYRQSIIDAARDIIEAWIIEQSTTNPTGLIEIDDPSSYAMARWMSNFSEPTTGHAAILAIFAVAEAEASRNRENEAVTIFPEEHLEYLDKLPATTQFLIRHRVATWYGYAGREYHAAIMLRNLLQDLDMVAQAPDRNKAQALKDYGFFLGEAGLLAEAANTLTSALTIASESSSIDDAFLLSTRSLLGRFIAEAGRIEEAIGILTDVLQQQRRILGRHHRDTLTTWSRLAIRVWEGQQPTQAMRMLTQIYNRQAQWFGPEDPDTLTTRQNRASFLGRSGRQQKAWSEYEEILTITESVYGSNHPVTLLRRNNMGKLAFDLGRTFDFETLLRDEIRTLGRDHYVTLYTRTTMAALIIHSDPAQALDLLDEVIFQWAHTSPGQLYPRFAARRLRAQALLELGSERRDEAIHELQTALAASQEILGDTAPMSQWIGRDLAKVC